MRARVLLKADEGVGETQIAQALDIHRRTGEKVRQRYCESGLERALHEKPRPGAQRKFDGKQEAHLIAVACSTPPDGRAHWTLKLLADEVVKLELAESISPETVRQVLKKATSSHGKNRNGASLR
jgi:transposase